MQGYLFTEGTDATGVAACLDCARNGNRSIDGRETVWLGEDFIGRIPCTTCDAEIDGEKETPTTFEVVGAASEVVTSWYRKVNVSYDGDVYAIELSYDQGNGYEWSELDDLPAELCELLNEADLFYLDEDVRAAANQ